MNITELTQSEKWKKFMGYVYGWGASVVLMGALFKIQHWPGSSIIYLCSILIVTITYSLRFILKEKKTIIDYTKVFWIVFAYLGFYFKIKHWILQDLFLYISIAIFWIGLLYLLYSDYKMESTT